MQKNYLLFDFGASHGRCIVAKYSGDRFEMEEIHEFENRPVRFAGTLYWDILRLVSEIKIGMQMAFAKYPDIVSVGIDTWGCDFGFITQEGRLLSSPTNYRDDLRHKYKPILDERFGEYNIFRLSGANTIVIMGLYHLYALVQESSIELQSADKFLMIPDLMNYYLTGIAANEYTDATMSLMVDQQRKVWQKEILEPLGIRQDLFCRMVMPGNVLGNLSQSICDELEVPSIPVINVASHDTASAIAGIPLATAEDNWAFISLGSWAIYGVETDAQYISREVFESGFANQGGCEGKTNFVNLFTGLWVIQQCYERWCKDAGKKIGWDSVVAEAEQANGGIAFIDLDAPEFAQPNTNMPLEIQKYCRTNKQTVPEGIGEISRCIFESMVLKFRRCFYDVKRFTGKDTRTLYLVGGGSKNKLICQWTADALGIQVLAGPAETTSVGNLLLQLKATGEIDSLNEGRRIAAASATQKEYLPNDTAKWDAYDTRYAGGNRA